MADTLFDLAAEKLEAGAGMDRLAARGTLRIAVKEAGLDPANLTVAQLQVVFEKLMPKELDARGIDDAEAMSRSVMVEISSCADSVETDSSISPDDVFARLGGK